MFKSFTEWVKVHPYQSIGYSIYIIAFSVVLTIPIFYTIVMLGLTYSQVFDSKMYGFLFSVPIVFTGTVIGGLVAFMLSRYLFKDFIKDQIANSEWASHKFNLINEILLTEGMLFVALIRLTAAPFGVMSYVFGVSSIPFTDYAMGHITYIVESSLLCFIGCSMYSAVQTETQKESGKNAQRITYLVEVAFTIIVTFAIGYISKTMVEKKLRQ
jgi:uncharacterized membrane protein YdjX (TVP38/TMEM64 family)